MSPQHISVFDTANIIRPEGHVLMVSAITPMISGSVSKTVNLPPSVEVEDVKNIHLLAYNTGTKAIAIYRDGCKASQPLTSGMQEDDEKQLQDCSYAELLEFAKECNKGVPKRRKPDGMRMSRTHAAKIGDIELYITIGFYDDGKIAEIFVSTDKDGTVVKGLLASLSKSISNMLQYNIPPEKISIMLRGQKYEPSGFVQRHPYIKYASSISDLISKVIDIECGDYSKCQVKPKASINAVDTMKNMLAPETKAVQLEMEIDGEKIYGEICSQCGS
ncbi:MAG: ribonucleoside-diphosphate reductase, partial [Eubacterium sp.]